jgi:hypothetical protein
MNNSDTSRILIIVRAGDTSLHTQWNIDRCEEWECWVSYFGDDPSAYQDHNTRRFDEKGPKWPALSRLINQNWSEVQRYDFIWLPDDDLMCTKNSLRLFFAICEAFHLDVSQPSLDIGSYISHPITLHDPRYLYRVTNFVEIMAPCFSIAALSSLRHSFSLSRSGWGLDYLWRELSDASSRFAIVDAAHLLHTRPVGGPSYNRTNLAGTSPLLEFRNICDLYGISDFTTSTLGGVPIASEVSNQFFRSITHSLFHNQ